MAYVIAENCLSCSACETLCPNNAISENDDIYIIDPDKCTECVGAYDSPRCAEVCSVDAPGPDPDHNESREQLLEKSQRLHPAEEPKFT